MMNFNLDKLAKDMGIDIAWKPTKASVEALSDEDTVSEATKGCCDIFAQVLQNLRPTRWPKAKRIRGSKANDPEQSYPPLDHVYLCSETEEVDIHGIGDLGAIEARFKAKGYAISNVEDVDLRQIEKEYTQAQSSTSKEGAVLRTSLRGPLCKRFERFVREHAAKFS